ncbi:MAG: hypothetical protein ACR5KX_05265 [Wolbachia sp.]
MSSTGMTRKGYLDDKKRMRWNDIIGIRMTGKGGIGMIGGGMHNRRGKGLLGVFSYQKTPY